MDILKQVLGAELYDQCKSKVDAHNADEANKDKQIKLGNLASGEYVGKGKFDALQETLNGKDSEIANANNLIAELEEATKGNEEMQKKFTEYEQEKAALIAELENTKVKAAIKVALLSEKAVDVDYLTFKLNEKLTEKGEHLELDENDNIKGWDDKIAGLKTQFPSMFSTAAENGGLKRLDDGRLQGSEGKTGLTRAEILKKPYAERVKIAEENPEAYEAAMRG